MLACLSIWGLTKFSPLLVSNYIPPDFCLLFGFIFKTLTMCIGVKASYGGKK
jgi:hypothetical protein